MSSPPKISVLSCTAIGTLFASVAIAHASEPDKVLSGIGGIQLEFDAGYSQLHLNGLKFTSQLDWLNTEAKALEDSDGRVSGNRFQGGVFVPVGHHNGRTVSVGITGFYARYEATKNSTCSFVDLVSDCAIFPLFDPDPVGTNGGDYTGGLLSEWVKSATTKVEYYGIAPELRFAFGGHRPSGSLKDGPVQVSSPVELRVGFGHRKLTQRTVFTGEDFGPLADPVDLTENLRTTYNGAYLGFATSHNLGGGLSLGVRGDGGVYAARSRYHGTYFSTESIGSPGVPVAQSLDLSENKPAFIGSLGADLSKDFGGVTVGVFGLAEWSSYAPFIKYNNTDRDGGGVLDVIGDNDGTSIGHGTAVSYTVGGRVTVPLHR